LRTWNAPLGRPEPSVPAAFVSSSVTEAGMPSTIQCQKPEPVGASGSKQVTAKLLVSAGNPDQSQRRGDVTPGHAEPVEDLVALHRRAVGDVVAAQLERRDGGMEVVGERRRLAGRNLLGERLVRRCDWYHVIGTPAGRPPPGTWYRISGGAA
jgi:hypothetical protein